MIKMSYADRLQKLVEYQTNIRSALEAKGATISSDATLKDFPSAVDTITGDYTGPTPVDIMENGWAPYYSLVTNTTKIASYAFVSASLSEVNFPYCSIVGESAFDICQSLENAYFPECKSIESRAFDYCTALSSIFIPKCEYIGNSAFNRCKLYDISLPHLTNLGSSAMADCDVLRRVYLPELTSCSDGTFYYCRKLYDVYIPKVSLLSGNVFDTCDQLSTLRLHNIAKISCATYRPTFGGCYNLRSLYLPASSVCTLTASAAFSTTPIVGYWHSSLCTKPGVYGSIFVPYNLIESYKTATNWAYLSDRIAGLVPFSVANLSESDSITTFVEGKESPVPLEVSSAEFTYSVYSKYPKYTGTQADMNENGEINISLPTDGVSLTVNTNPEDATVKITEDGIVDTYTKTKLLNSGDTVDYIAYKEIDETKNYYYAEEHNTITVNNNETVNVSLGYGGYRKITATNTAKNDTTLKKSILTLFDVDGDALKSKLDCKNSKNESGYFVYTTPNTITKLRFSAYHKKDSYSDYSSIVLRISTVLDENSYPNYNTLTPDVVLQDGNVLCVKITQNKKEYEVELEPSTTYYFQEFYARYGISTLGVGIYMYIEDMVLYEDLGKIVPIFATNADKVYGLVNSRFFEGLLLTGDVGEFTYTAYADGKPKITGTQADVDSSGVLNVTFPENGVTLSASSAQDGSKIRFIQDYHYVTMGNQVVVNSGDTVEVEGLNPFYSSKKTKVTVDTDKHIDIELTELESMGDIFNFNNPVFSPVGSNTYFDTSNGFYILNKDIQNVGDYAIACVDFVTPPNCEYRIGGVYTSNGGTWSCHYIAKLSTSPLDSASIVGSNRVTTGDIFYTDSQTTNQSFSATLQGGTHYYLYLACERISLTNRQDTGKAFTVPYLSFTKTN